MWNLRKCNDDEGSRCGTCRDTSLIKVLVGTLFGAETAGLYSTQIEVDTMKSNIRKMTDGRSTAEKYMSQLHMYVDSEQRRVEILGTDCIIKETIYR